MTASSVGTARVSGNTNAVVVFVMAICAVGVLGVERILVAPVRAGIASSSGI